MPRVPAVVLWACHLEADGLSVSGSRARSQASQTGVEPRHQAPRGPVLPGPCESAFTSLEPGHLGMATVRVHSMETSQYHLSAFFLDSQSPHTMAAPNVGDSSCEVTCATGTSRRGAQRGSPAHTLAPAQLVSTNGCGAPVCQIQALGLGSWAPGSLRSHQGPGRGTCSKINVGRERRLLLPRPPGLSLIPRAPQLPNTTHGSCSQAQLLGGKVGG